jgi:hypothetical protein
VPVVTRIGTVRTDQHGIHEREATLFGLYILQPRYVQNMYILTYSLQVEGNSLYFGGTK